MTEGAKRPQQPPGHPARARGLREPAYIRISVDPHAKSQFVRAEEAEAWRERLAWDARVTSGVQGVVDVPCVPGQGLPRERPMLRPVREWGQMSARQAHQGSAGWGSGVGSGSALPKQTAATLSARAQFHPPDFRRPSSRRRRLQQPVSGQQIKGAQPTRGNPSLLWGENGRDDRNAANWCSTLTAVHQRNGSPAPTARPRVFVFDEDVLPVPESNSYKALTARIEQHRATIKPPPRTPTSVSHREGAWVSRAHAWNLDRGWRPTSSGALFGC